MFTPHKKLYVCDSYKKVLHTTHDLLLFLFVMYHEAYGKMQQYTYYVLLTRNTIWLHVCRIMPHALLILLPRRSYYKSGRLPANPWRKPEKPDVHLSYV